MGNSRRKHRRDLRGKKLVLAVCKYMILLGLFSFLFYRSAVAFLCMLPLLGVLLVREQKRYRKALLRQLNLQFGDALQAVSTALSAGYSVESAFWQAREELKLLYSEEAPIMQEFAGICRGLELNETIETLLFSFAARTGLEDVKSFAEVFDTAKRTGGDLPGVIAATTGTIRDKLKMEREIARLTGAKRFEQKIMNAVPCAMLFYVSLTSPEFLAPMYGNPAGAAVMSGCLLLYGAGLWLGERMLALEV